MTEMSIDSIVMGEDVSIDSILMGEEDKDASIDSIVMGEEVATPVVETPAFEDPSVEPIVGETIQEKMASAYLHPELGERDILGMSLLREPIMESIKTTAKEMGMGALASAEFAMGICSGMLLYLPSKMYGVMALSFGREVMDIAEEEITKLGYQPYTDKGKEALEVVGKGFEAFLASAEGADKLVSKLSPRLGYLVGLGIELAMFAMGAGSVKGIGAKFKPTIESAQKLVDAKRKLELDAIGRKEKAADLIPDEILKNAQKKVLEVEKIQAELEAKAAMEKLDYGEMIKQDLGSKTTQIKKIKQPAREIADMQIDRALERIKVEEPKVPVEPKVEKPTNLDLQTGTREPVELKSIFDDTLERTNQMKQLYKERVKNVNEDVELFTGKAINDVNRWRHGDESIKIEDVRNGLSELAARADEMRSAFAESPDFPANFDTWKVGVEEAAGWARRVSREVLEVDIHKTELGLNDPLVFRDTRGNVKSVQASDYREVEAKTGISFGYDGVGEASRNPKLSNVQYFGGIPHSPILENALLWTKKKMPTLWKLIDNVQVLPGGILKGDPIGSYRREFKTMNLTYDPKHITTRGYVGTIVHELAHAFESRRFEIKGEGVFAADLGSKALKVFDKDRSKIEPPGVTLAVGIPLDKAAKDIVAGARKVAEYTRKARGMKAFRPATAAKMIREEFNRSFVDRSGNIRIDLLNKLGDDGYKAIQKMYLSKGASSISANMLKQMRKEVYGGLTRSEKKILDNLILADRMVAIGRYKTEKQFKFPEEINPKNSVAYSELFQQIEKLTPEKAADIRSRVRAYTEWMKKPLKDMLDAELITEQEFNDLNAHNYRRLKLVEVYDKQYQAKVGKKKRTVYDSGIESLARGRETDVFEPSSEIMALEVFNRAYGRILNNEANKGLAEVARKDSTNPFARIKEKEGDKIPSGWNRIFFYEKGERKSIYLSPEMSKEWITSNPEMSYRMSQFIRHASLSPVLRTFATGINWGFALANLPRDVMHTWFTARTFQDGKWKPVYNPNLPVFGLQMGRDLSTIFTDAALRKGRYQDYINEGGGMEFMVHQGRLFQRGRHVEGSIDKAYDFLGYFGETSEVMTRLAIRERVIRRRAKEQGLTMEQARKNKDITREATFTARDYMDFGQGGGIGKALDNGIPYLNAAIIGTRGLWRSFKPGSGSAMSSTYKLAQLAAITTGLYIANNKLNPKTMEALRGSIDMENNLCIPLGDGFGFEDEKGQMRYPYFEIPLDPGQKFFKTFFEGCTDKWLGNEVDVDRITGSLKQFSPVGTTSADILPPSISSTLGYVTDKDFWLNEDIWRKTDKTFGYQLPTWAGGPKVGGSKEEYIPGVTPQVYKDFGQMTGLSPERTKYAVEEIVTGGTLWSYLAGQGYEAMFGEMPKNEREQHLAMVLSKIPVVKRFFGVTNPYTKHAGNVEKVEEKASTDRWVQNRGLDMRVNGYLYEDNTTRKEIFDYIKEFKDPKVSDRLLERFNFQVATKDLPERSLWLRMRGMPVEAKARIYVDRLNKATPEERIEIRRELSKVLGAKGLISDEFWVEVGKLQREEIMKAHDRE